MAEASARARRNDVGLAAGVDLPGLQVHAAGGGIEVTAQALVEGVAGDEEALGGGGGDVPAGGRGGAGRIPALFAQAYPRARGADAVLAGAQGEGVAGVIARAVDKHGLCGIERDLHGTRCGEVADEDAGVLEQLLEEELPHVR